MNTSTNDGFKDGGPSSTMRYPTGEKLGSLPSFRSDRSYDASQAPGSPSGSIESSSVISRGSDTGRSVRSSMSLRSQKDRPTPQQADIDMYHLAK